VILKPPTTPPYFLVIFSSVHVLVSLVDLGFDAVEIDARRGTLARDIVSMFIPVLFVWVAGTLPLQAQRPALNIAQSKDVCFLYCYLRPLVKLL
jgi:hypothetical protein